MSIWTDHLHRGDPALVDLLERNDVATHPMVVGELALGSVANRTEVLALPRDLPAATGARGPRRLSSLAWEPRGHRP